MKFKAIAFDLDDTLVDTTHLLVPMASKAAFEAMAAEGLQTTFETFEAERRLGALSMNHQRIFQGIAERYGQPFSESLVNAGIKAFYYPPLPEKLGLLPGALENLNLLKPKYKLYLVTTGALKTQQEKVQRADIASYFEKMFFLDSFKKERKRIAFSEILTTLKIQPHELLVIGNRLSQEIRDGKELGCYTCYFKYGEHVGEVAQDKLEHPDIEIFEHKEFVQACQL